MPGECGGFGAERTVGRQTRVLAMPDSSAVLVPQQRAEACLLEVLIMG